MRGALFLCAAALLSGCATDLQPDFRGVRCNADGSCPPGLSCVAGACQERVCVGASCSPVDGGADGGEELPDAGVCAGQLCVSPPAAECQAGGGLRRYISPGSCLDPSSPCSYGAVDVACANGCDGGVCLGQPKCTADSCKAVPKPSCVAGAVRIFVGPGACVEATGACTFTFVDQPCPGTCSQGVCTLPPLTFRQSAPQLTSAVSAVDVAPGSSGASALAVGPKGYAARWNGTSWSPLTTQTTVDLSGVWFASGTVAYALGGGKLLRIDGSQVTLVNVGAAAGTPAFLHGSGPSHLLLAATDGRVWTYDGSSWGSTYVANSGWTVKGLFVDPQGKQRVVGQCGFLFMHPCVSVADGVAGSWSTASDSTSDTFGVAGPSPSGSSYAWVARGLTVRRHAGNGTLDATEVPSTLEGGAVVAISGTPGAASYVLTSPGGGKSGQLTRFVRTGAEPSGPLWSVDGPAALSRNESSGVLLAERAGSSANVYRLSPNTKEALHLAESWVAASHSPNGAVYLMNAGGDLAVRARGAKAFTFARSGSSRTYRALVGANTYAVAAGDSGVLSKWTAAGGFSELTHSAAGVMRAGCRVNDSQVLFVGDAGKALVFNGTSASALPTGTTKDLKAIHCAPNGFGAAVGAGSTVLKLSGGSFSPLPAPPGSAVNLTGVYVTAEGVVYAAGDGVFARHDGASWALLPTSTGVTSLFGGGAVDVYGLAGAKVMRFDGAAWSPSFTAPAPLSAAAHGGLSATAVGADGLVIEGG